jgi:hypothetical protein
MAHTAYLAVARCCAAFTDYGAPELVGGAIPSVQAWRSRVSPTLHPRAYSSWQTKGSLHPGPNIQRSDVRLRAVERNPATAAVVAQFG